MESPSTFPWWPVVRSRIAHEPLPSICASLQVDAAGVLAALAGVDQPAHIAEAIWWPELRRMWEDGAPIRSLARCFLVEPRRIRRALARAALRVSGVNLNGSGVAALAGLRRTLGHMPDIMVARAASVAVEAVVGERRRLGVAPFLQRRQRRHLTFAAARPSPRPPSARPAVGKPPLEPVVVRRPTRAPPAHLTQVAAADDARDARLGRLRAVDGAITATTPSAPSPGAISAPRRIVRPPRPTVAELTADPATPSRGRRGGNG